MVGALLAGDRVVRAVLAQDADGGRLGAGVGVGHQVRGDALGARLQRLRARRLGRSRGGSRRGNRD
jgi:hypothetical protein